MTKSMQVLKHFVTTGWPNQRKDRPTIIRDHWNHRDELAYSNGLIFKGDHIVISPALREDMLNQIRKRHFGIEKHRSRARQALFWPGMNADIQHVVTNCNTCMSFQNANAKEPLINYEIPTLPWQIIGTDLFSLCGRDYIGVVDYYNRYFEVERLYDTRSSAVIKKIKSILACHGKCQKMISDNGPYKFVSSMCYTSDWVRVYSSSCIIIIILHYYITSFF